MQAQGKPRFIILTAFHGSEPYPVRVNVDHIIAYCEANGYGAPRTYVKRTGDEANEVMVVKETPDQIDQLIDKVFEL
jgi:hypothetical protein